MVLFLIAVLPLVLALALAPFALALLGARQLRWWRLAREEPPPPPRPLRRRPLGAPGPHHPHGSVR